MAGRRWHTDGVYERWEMGARWSIAITTHLMGRRSLQLVFNNFCCCFSVLRMRFLLLLLLLLSLLLYLFLFFTFCIKRFSFALHATQNLSWVEFLKSVQRRRRQPHQLLVRVCVCVCLETTQTVDIYHQGCPSRGWKLSNLSTGRAWPEACAVISFAFSFSGLQIRKMLHENQ